MCSSLAIDHGTN
uniref:Uncharacterized protein n=1 Tax=Arundo donax TaxID=35708 RepID=A0A0A9HAU3_ARUDO